jgi:serine/threonine protein kinase
MKTTLVACLAGHQYDATQHSNCPFCAITSARFIAGRYQLIRIIGRGSVGKVWLATDRILARQVALKLFLRNNYDKRAVNHFTEEARALARLSHQSIVAVFDAGEDDEHLYIATEFIDGADLAAMISMGKIRISWALRVAVQVASGLKYAHSLTMLHRDIKPSNILIANADDRVVITDFGLAKNVSSLSTATGSSWVVGTPAYMSPEQSSGNEIYASDIFSFGVTLFHLFTGTLPNGQDGAGKFCEGKSPSELRSDIPEAISDLIMRMIKSNHLERLTNINEIEEMLRYVANEFDPTIGETLIERAIEIFYDVPVETSLSVDSTRPVLKFKKESENTGTFYRQSDRFEKMEDAHKFYRQSLKDEYKDLSRQANLTYQLWVGCVGLGFLILLAGILLMIFGKLQQGIGITASTSLVYFIQRIFQQREDHYRDLAASKNENLEYGNHWLLVTQTIDTIDEPEERRKQQLILLERLNEKLSIVPPNKKRPTQSKQSVSPR